MSGPDPDPVTCRECGDVLDDWGTYVVYGEWDRGRQGFARGDHSWHVCYDCWHKEYDARKATRYQTEDGDELWAILNASGGRLVADLSTFYIPGPCYARVVDDELEVCTVDHTVHQATQTIDAEAAYVDEHDLFLDTLLENNSEPECPIYLVTLEETPFTDLIDHDE